MAALTTEPRYAASWKQWRSAAKPRNRQAPQSDPRLARAEAALRYAYGPVMARVAANPADGRLDIAPPSYAKACVRNHAMVQQLARDLGEYWWRIAQYNAKSNAGAFRRAERRHREDAAIELIELVHKMVPPQRQVIELRACGWSWRQICAAQPGRVYALILDDYKRGLAALMDRHGDVVARVG